MSSNFKNIFPELEELIAESSRTNTEIISETTKFLSNLSTSSFNPQNIKNLQQNLFAELLQKITILNINYAKDLMRMGVELTKKLNDSPKGIDSNNSIVKPPMKSSITAFKLNAITEQGGIAETAFLLNSDKEVPIICKVQNAAFLLNSDNSIFKDFKTEYSPQLFELIKGIAQRVNVKINIPNNTPEGTFSSKITVAGFEHVHFELVIEVLKKKKATVRKTTTKTAASKPKSTTSRTIKARATSKETSTTRANKTTPMAKKTTATAKKAVASSRTKKTSTRKPASTTKKVTSKTTAK